MYIFATSLFAVSLAIAATRFKRMSLSETHFGGLAAIRPSVFDSIRVRIIKFLQDRRDSTSAKVAKLLTDEVGKCFICLNVPRMPTKLRSGCACSVYGCNPCVYEYVRSGIAQRCPTCRRDVFYADCPPGARYDNQIGLWRINDSIDRELRPFNSRCQHCDFDDGTQVGLNVHVNHDCGHFKVKCYECGLMVNRNLLRKHKELNCGIGQIGCECGWLFVGPDIDTQAEYNIHLITRCPLFSQNVSNP